MKSKSFKNLPDDDLSHILTHTRELWERLRGASFFITGGTGFFGRWLLESFSHANDEMNLGMTALVLSRDYSISSDRQYAGVRFMCGECKDFMLPGGHFDYIIHAANGPGMTEGAKRIVYLSQKKNVHNILFTSSGAVYGEQRVPFVSESDPCAANTSLGLEKIECERILIERGAKVARCFTFVGPHLPMDGRFAIGRFLGDVMAGQPIRVTGGERIERSYLYSADIVIWLLKILLDGRRGGIYNVGSSDSVSVEKLANEDGAMAGCMVLPGKLPDQLPNRYVPAVGLAEKELGLRVLVGRDDAIRRTLNWLGH